MTHKEFEQLCKDNGIDNVNAFIEFLYMWLEAPEDRKQAAEQFLYACEAGCTTKEAIDRVENAEIREEMTRTMLAKA